MINNNQDICSTKNHEVIPSSNEINLNILDLPPTINRSRLLCSTGVYASPSDKECLKVIVDYGSKLNVDGIELIMYSSWYNKIETVAYELGKSGLNFPVLHAEKGLSSHFGDPSQEKRSYGLKQFELNCILASSLKSEIVVLHLWGLPNSDENIEYNFDVLEGCLLIAEKHRLKLTVETVPCRKHDPLFLIKQITGKYKNCFVTIDTRLLAVHNQLELLPDSDWLWDANLIRHIHISDYSGFKESQRNPLQPGEGCINFDNFFNMLKYKNYGGMITLESRGLTPEKAIDDKSIQKSLLYLKQMIRQ